MGIACSTCSNKKSTGPTSKSALGRRCIVSGEIKDKPDLVRFVLDPDGCVVPDIAAQLPGRGLWVSADREAITQAVNKNLFSRAAKTKAVVPSGLVDMTEGLLRQRCLDLLGLARRAGVVFFGMPQIEQGIREGSIAFILLAADAGSDVRSKLSRTKCYESGFSRQEIGAAVGRELIAALGFGQHGLGEAVLCGLKRWQNVCPSPICYN